MGTKRDDIVFLEVILTASTDILQFIESFDEDRFLRDRLVRSAVLMQLIVIGEYGVKISDDLKEQFTEVEWQQMKAARNFYVHVYNSVDWKIVWETVTSEIPNLKHKIQNILEELGKA